MRVALSDDTRRLFGKAWLAGCCESATQEINIPEARK